MCNKFLFVLSILLFGLTNANSQKRKLVPADIYKIKSTGGGLVSPDGKWFVYTISTPDSAKDKFNTDIWMMSWDGKENIQLTNSPEAESNAKWSPDGRYISFTTARAGGSSQVYLLNRLGGEAIKLTDVKGDLENYEWSPDSKRLALVITDPQDTSKLAKSKPWVIDRYHFKQDREGYLYQKEKSHIYLFDNDSKKLDTLTRGRYDESGVQWSPDGSQLAFVSNRTEDPDKNENSDIYVIAAKAGAEMRQLTTWKGVDNSPQWSPDGKTIAYLRSTADDNFIMYDQPILCIINATGGEPVLLSKELDRPVGNPRWNKAGTEIATLVTDDCRRYVATIEVSSKKIITIASGDQLFNSLEPHPNGGWIASMTDPQTPSELYAIENGKWRKLTSANDDFLKQVSVASVQKIISTSKEGTNVSNMVFTPLGSDGKNMPVIFFIHGGPVAQDGFGFDFTRQILAANDYAVVAVNYRGSNGKGIAFSKSIYADWGNKEVKDIIGAADYLIKNGIIDADKMGIGGWSYGGILTNYTIATDTRFKAACSGAGSANQLALYGVDQYINQLNSEVGPPWEGKNLQKYLKFSYPFLQANKIKTPTLFMSGEKDFNVPAVGSEQMYQALRTTGIPTELIVYPGQFHGFSSLTYQKDRLERYNNWFDKYIKKKSF